MVCRQVPRPSGSIEMLVPVWPAGGAHAPSGREERRASPPHPQSLGRNVRAPDARVAHAGTGEPFPGGEGRVRRRSALQSRRRRRLQGEPALCCRLVGRVVRRSRAGERERLREGAGRRTRGRGVQGAAAAPEKGGSGWRGRLQGGQGRGVKRKKEGPADRGVRAECGRAEPLVLRELGVGVGPRGSPCPAEVGADGGRRDLQILP